MAWTGAPSCMQASQMWSVIVQVDLPRLRALPKAQAEAALEKVASVRSVMLGLPLRCNTARPVLWWRPKP